MALVLADRVRDTTTTTGTGTVTLSGTAPTGYQTFATAIGNANTTYYTINAGFQWEVGIGTFTTSGNTLTRDTVLSSSSGGALVDFAVGTKDVFVTYPAEKSVNYNESDNVGIGTTAPTRLLSVYDGDAAITKDTASAASSIIYMNKGRGSAGAPANISSGDNLGAVWFNGYSGSGNNNGYGYGAYVGGAADGAVSAGTVPGRLVFATTTSGDSSPTERMRIDSAGNVGIGTSAPQAPLHVYRAGGGSVRIDTDLNASSTQLNFATAGVSKWSMYRPGGSNDLRMFDNANVIDVMTWQAGGNVLVGTTTADNKLTVSASSNGAAAGVLSLVNPNDGVGTASDLDFVIHSSGTLATGRIRGLAAGADNYPMSFWTYGSGGIAERMRINNAGQLLVGTTTTPGSPNARIVAGGTTDAGIQLASTSGGGALILAPNGAGTTFYTYTGAVGSESYTERMRIDTSGNVGIGTSAPIAPLDIAANLGTFSGTGNAILRLNNVNSNGQSPLDFVINGTLRGRFRSDYVGNMNYVVNGGSHTFLVGGDSGVGTVRMTLDATTLDINANAKVPSGSSFYWGDATSQITAVNAGAMRFLTGNASEKMRIDASGNVGIGTTAPSYKLQVNAASGGNQVAYFINDSVGSTLAGVAVSINGGGNNTNSFHFAGVTQTVALWYLYGNGTTSYTSDIRVKKNVETTRDGYLEDVCKLRVVKYNWYNDSDDTPRELGFIAQEVEQVFPGLVQDAMHPTKDGICHKVLKGSVMMPIMLKALQEASAQIEALTARVAQLEATTPTITFEGNQP